MTTPTLCPHFDSPHAFFGRNGGVSTGIYTGLNCGPGSGDSPDNVLENRQIAAEYLSGSRETPLVSCYQVHGAWVTYTVGDWGEERPKSDAMVTNVPGLILGILTADCTPVLFEDAEARIIGAAHAGWQGALSGVLEATIAVMENTGADRSRIKAAIGPTIHQPSYEIGEEFRARLQDVQPEYARFFAEGRDPNHFQFDLPGFAKHRLKQAGLQSIWMSDIDTYSSDDHFSFRRTTHKNEPDYGRQLSAIMLKP